MLAKPHATLFADPFCVCIIQRRDFYFQFYSFYLELALKFYWSDWWFCVLMKSRYDSGNNRERKKNKRETEWQRQRQYVSKAKESAALASGETSAILNVLVNVNGRTHNDTIFVHIRMLFPMYCTSRQYQITTNFTSTVNKRI